MKINTSIVSVGVSVPPFSISQEEICSYVEPIYKDILNNRSMQLFLKMLHHPSIRKRHFSIDPPYSLNQLRDETPDQKVERFVRWARSLGREAIQSALDKAHLSIKNIDALFVNTCTGYVCPGISTYLIEDLGFSPGIKAFDLVGSGCGGAIPNIQLASQFCQSHPGCMALSLSVEICTATFQIGNDISLLLSNTLFGDGAAAVILSDQTSGVRLLESTQLFLPEYREHVRYVHKNGQLHNQLSKSLPETIGMHIEPFVSDLLNSCNIELNDIDHFLIHTGGYRVLEMCAQSLKLSDLQMATSRKILSDYGNLSSPTVLFELNDIFPRITNNKLCLMVAFGAGLSMYGMILRGS